MEEVAAAAAGTQGNAFNVNMILMLVSRSHVVVVVVVWYVVVVLVSCCCDACARIMDFLVFWLLLLVIRLVLWRLSKDER